MGWMEARVSEGVKRERSWWGWGWADQALDADACAKLARRVSPFLPLDGELAPVPAVPDVRPSRLRVPAAVAGLCRDDARTRAAHAYGRAYRDVVRLLRGE